jgi:hypothetical protein
MPRSPRAGGGHPRRLQRERKVSPDPLVPLDHEDVGRTGDLHRGAPDVVLGHGRRARRQPHLVAHHPVRSRRPAHPDLGATGLGGDVAPVDLDPVGGHDDGRGGRRRPGVAQDADDLVLLSLSHAAR